MRAVPWFRVLLTSLFMMPIFLFSEANMAGNFEEDPFYPLALLKTSFEEKHQDTRKFQELFNHMLEETQIDTHEFGEYLERYHEDLRKNCRLKGYV